VTLCRSERPVIIYSLLSTHGLSIIRDK
jgi:hypothetical protein